jgi:hypothetical protein
MPRLAKRARPEKVAGVSIDAAAWNGHAPDARASDDNAKRQPVSNPARINLTR